MKNSLQPEFKVIRSNRKSLAIELGHNSMKIRAPYQMSDAEISRFILAKQDWIREKQLLLSKKSPPKHQFVEGEKFLMYGEEYPLKFVEKQPFALKFDTKEFLLNSRDLHRAHILFKAWYINQAKFSFPKRVEDYASKYGFKYKTVRISDAARRWGSCSSSGSINLNWRLMRAIPEVIDYVIVHELAHTRHMDHSTKFWELVADVMPNYKTYRIWLKEHGYMLDFLAES